MKAFKQFVFRYGKYQYALPVMMIGFALQAVLIFKYLPRFLAYSGGIKNPDQLFSYDFKYLSNLYQALGEKGRNYYAQMLGVDFFYTSISAFGFAFLLAALVKKEQWVILLPFCPALVDVGENIGQLVLMGYFPNISSSGAMLASGLSSIKMLLGLISMALILFYVIKNLIFWLMKKSRA